MSPAARRHGTLRRLMRSPVAPHLFLCVAAAGLLPGCPTPAANTGGETPAVKGTPTSVEPRAASDGDVIVVAIVIDQLPMWLAVERWGGLPPTGGFSKLLAEASAVAELHHGQSQSSTAPGHAALFTGCTPRDSGITANGRLDDSGKYESFLADPQTKLVTAAGPVDRTSSSVRALQVPTVADALKEQRPGALVVSLSMKDRGAIFGAGRKPDAVLWFDAATDALVTSTAYANEPPAWAKGFAASGAGAKYRQEAWIPLDPKWLAGRTDLPAPDLGQGDFHGLGAKFPHDVAKSTKPPSAFLATPFADTMLIDAAIAAVDHVASSKGPALVSVSLSATDYVGHMFGPDAPEAWDHMLRLDAELARLFSHLDERLGSKRYAVVLSSDHGVASTPEVMNQGFCGRPDKDRFERRCDKSFRLYERDLAKVAEDAADKAGGPGDWVLGANEPFVVLRPSTRALPKDKLDPIAAAIQKALAAVPGVARVVDVRNAPAQCPSPEDESMDALVCRSTRGATGGDFFIVPKPGVFTESGYVEGDGVNHGTPYLFDRAVPLVVRAPREAAMQPSATKSFDSKVVVDQRAFAKTIAGLVGIDAPACAAQGTDLSSPR